MHDQLINQSLFDIFPRTCRCRRLLFEVYIETELEIKMTKYSIPRISEQVAKQIVDYISFNRLELGAKLPTERDLSELLEASRSSIREGLRVLEILGYVHSKQGNGTFVSKSEPFLIPQQVIHERPTSSQLDDYFEIAMMVAEKIIKLSMKQKEMPSYDHIEDWYSLSNFVISLAETLGNPYYKSLWESTYLFLYEHQYFQQAEKTVQIALKQLFENSHC